MFSKFEIRPRNKKSTTDLIVKMECDFTFKNTRLMIDDTVDNINNEHKHQNIETGQLKSIKRQHTSQDGKN